MNRDDIIRMAREADCLDKFTTTIKSVSFIVNDYCSITFKAPVRITPDAMRIINRAVATLSLMEKARAVPKETER